MSSREVGSHRRENEIIGTRGPSLMNTETVSEKGNSCGQGRPLMVGANGSPLWPDVMEKAFSLGLEQWSWA